MGSVTSPLFSSFHTTFTPLFSFYTLKINGTHHFTHFSFYFSLILYLFINHISVPNPFDKKWEGQRKYISKLIKNNLITPLFFPLTNPTTSYTTLYIFLNLRD